jgi:hypothetical protein
MKAEVMTKLLLPPALLSLLLQPVSSVSRPTITPMFVASSGQRGPAFFIECVNDTDRTVSSGSELWVLTKRAIRIDGNVLNEEGGRIGPGLTMDVRPGGTWRGIIELWQSDTGSSLPVAFGALVRAPFRIPLNSGRHTIAVQCADSWSDELTFFVEK